MNTKKVLQQLKEVFSPEAVETQLSEIETKVEEVQSEVEKIELAEEPKEEPKQEVAPQVEYATKLELEEMKRKFMDLFESFQKENETKKEVPQELSKDVELSSDVEDIVHSPELEVEKKIDLHKPQLNNQTIQSRVYSKLFN